MEDPMFLARMAALGMTGCVIHTDGDPFGDGSDVEDALLEVSPSEVGPGTSALTVQDYAFEVDFDEVYDVRALGDFEILEWSTFEDELSLVVSVPSDTRGQQTLALDFGDGTAYATFEVF
jgi:hypothetical protein